ncbi:MAG: four helix bundle protein [Bacteroidia bacterium]|nr:four helix bundle protein [Bacteroidia bacterium]
MRNFRKLEVWVDALDLAKDVYSFKDQLPKSEIYGLSSQLCRAVVSISSNLAEGCSRKSEKEFVRFIEIAMGSAFEVESLLILSKELELATNFDYQPISLKLEKLQKKINALRNHFANIV